jgi:predicted phage baseplate assembly protein
VDRVFNHIDAIGGIDPETVELAQLRAPQLVRSRGRAVTAADYEALAMLADSRVQRARCVQPPAGSASEGPLAGQIYLLLIPKVNRPERYVEPHQLLIEEELRDSVRDYLDDYRLLTVRVDIREPEYLWVAAEISVSPAAGADPERVQADVERRLLRFLNPIVGGLDGDGWTFGRDLYPSDVYACLQAVRGIDFIKSLQLYWLRSSADRTEITEYLSVPVHGLVVSADHRVTIL